MTRGDGRPAGVSPPDTAVLYSVEDVAMRADVEKAAVVRLCLAGVMPPWMVVQGRRYWNRAGAKEAVAVVRDAARRRAA